MPIWCVGTTPRLFHSLGRLHGSNCQTARGWVSLYPAQMQLAGTQSDDVESGPGQTDWSGPELTLENWREVVRRRFETISFEHASLDVRPFLVVDEDI